jgi:hypothetical protein
LCLLDQRLERLQMHRICFVATVSCRKYTKSSCRTRVAQRKLSPRPWYSTGVQEAYSPTALKWPIDQAWDGGMAGEGCAGKSRASAR